ncbi:conotoxin-like precursor unassigned superfamily 20 [Biomphalaria pfeifferi]|uniref:Conotoxin-like unassigned superfamily 20 n=1 Tax=Biomphalaria pfeifferi TaxID=112525 RepID=A0AAD8AP24_BIOPF|nr:conotoxin-like precursor unassigned superfamily 20; partial [Biomphalaria glabrata]KAK0039337.1 conotoxin-like precursor unassigned superfamily 20 [Biomphalaria pfeifferi]KAI8725831.1 conotoxin-like precursor unassigned superfamily 20; partial [Biomphalaria glabrata]KAI8726029.1 conotoxin precursor unassigned superfamily 20 [Biomphalaria glabrata]KAI8726069.1 conotoxin precursor unassigned superfamily 20 [Biomphalaria glabrata]
MSPGWARPPVASRRGRPSSERGFNLPVDCLSYAAAPRGSSASAGIQQPTQNWYGPGESDCLIKTKHCDGRHPVLTQCDFCPVL